MQNGIILLDKEYGRTSRDMVNELNHIFGMKKIGHTGTLDPIATGILVMCLGKYTKLVEELSSLEKEYIATIKLGIKTDTLDITGNILEKRVCKVQKSAVEEVFASLKGKIEQEIPIYSAKKINGKKLYEYARERVQVNLPKNIIEIYDITLLSINEDEIVFKTKVSKGTYIRSLIAIICQKLNVIGTMQSLRRTKQGRFDVKDAYTLLDIKNNNYKILKAQDILAYNTYNLSDDEYQKVKNGSRINLNIIDDNIILLYKNNEVAIYTKENDYYKAKIMLI